MTRKRKRLAVIGGMGSVLAMAAALVLFSLSDSIVFFYGPTEVFEKNLPAGTRIRVGGLVVDGSVKRGEDRVVAFNVTDGNKEITVSYRGILPDLFREGQGVVAEGVLQPGPAFRADTVLAKHDENYMPKEVADALKKQGNWQGEAKAGETR
jgi:cytochrome c-type biogenesis protein CcmE